MILIDTHVLMWMTADAGRLGGETRRLLEAGSVAGEIAISSISGWEITMLVDKRRIMVDVPIARWMEKAVAPGIEVIAVDLAIAMDAGSLPGNIHGDPCDRLLIATARQMQCTLVTVDRAVLEYGEQGYVRVHNGRR